MRAPPRLTSEAARGTNNMTYMALPARARAHHKPFLFISSNGEPRVNVACGGWRRATQLDVALSVDRARQSGGASHTHLPQAGGVS
jgi:hypothetical protein